MTPTKRSLAHGKTWDAEAAPTAVVSADRLDALVRQCSEPDSGYTRVAFPIPDRATAAKLQEEPAVPRSFDKTIEQIAPAWSPPRPPRPAPSLPFVARTAVAHYAKPPRVLTLPTPPAPLAPVAPLPAPAHVTPIPWAPRTMATKSPSRAWSFAATAFGLFLTVATVTAVVIHPKIGGRVPTVSAGSRPLHR